MNKKIGCGMGEVFRRGTHANRHMLVSTLKVIFQGKRELFDGLAIAKTDYNWKPYPVIHLDMGDPQAGTAAMLETSRVWWTKGRRYLLCLIMCGIVTAGGSMEAAETPILVNHAGLVPAAGKYCVVRGSDPSDFEVVDVATQKTALKGRLSAIQGDFGAFLVGDFSALKTAGTYEVRTAKARSQSFRIGPDVYADALKSTIRYFSVQRCGASKTGYHAPCHTDDGKRLDNGKHQDVSGGWHDACDVRKWVVATVDGLLGLAAVAEVLKPDWDQGRIIEEMRWGNQYFLKMQEPAGYLMNYCGGDDGNRWTDNTVSADDRPIHTEPCDASAQFRFIAAQCVAVHGYRSGVFEVTR
jgi:hypothetical protein